MTQCPPVLFALGRVRNLNRLPVDGLTVEHLAGVLAKINRYAGHTPAPYSVAQHAVLVSVLAPLELAYEALHHDDTEAFVGDLVGPIKVWCPEFQAIERRVRRRLAPVFGLKPVEPRAIRRYDLEALRLEQWHLQGRRDVPKSERTDCLEIQNLLQPLPWTAARDLFLWQHDRLKARQGHV